LTGARQNLSYGCRQLPE